MLLAASTERSMSAEVVLTLELTSLDAATSALWAFCADVWMLSVVLAVTAASDRSISAEIALIWLAASAEIAVSELCASRALLRIEAAVSWRHRRQRTLRIPGAAQDRGHGRLAHYGQRALSIPGAVEDRGDGLLAHSAQRALRVPRAVEDRGTVSWLTALSEPCASLALVRIDEAVS